MKVALVEDDPDQAELLASWLHEERHESRVYETGTALLEELSERTFDLIVLDWGLPDMPGVEVLSRVRSKLGWSLPVLFVTSRDREEDVVHALRSGADDYLSKPINRAETLARIEALGRRARPGRDEGVEIELDPYRINLETHTISRENAPVELTRMEFELAAFLFRHRGELLSRSEILESVWGTRGDLNTRTVDTHVSRIRNKLALSPQCGWRLSSVYQQGYRLERLGTRA